jgi:Serine/threonine protein kinase
MGEFKNSIDQIEATEWTQIFSLFDTYCELSESEQTHSLVTAQLSEPAKDMLARMLQQHNKPFILNRTIDPLIEQLLGKEVTEVYLNPTEIIGRNFGPWRATASLGSGGMGQVFTAERADGQYEKQVALKIIKSGHFSAFSKQRFLDEMRTLAQFEHPNIAHLIDGGTSEDDIAYFVMERISGQTIIDYANQHKLSLRARIRLLLQAIDATEYAHQNLIIHGDIKPANLLVNEAGQIKLVDFGIARPVQTNDKETYLPQFTPSYSAPEQAQGKPLSTASDVFGLCAVLYELCTGTAPRNQSPFTTETDHSESINTPITPAFQRFQTQSKGINHSPSQNRALAYALNHELGSIINKGLQLKSTDRYKNTTELRRDLRLFLDGSAVPVYASHPWYRMKKSIAKYKVPLTMLSLSVVGIVMLAFYGFHQARLAQQEADKAQWTNQFLLSIFDSADPVKNQQNPLTVNALTALAADKVLKDDSNLLLKTESLSTLSQIQYRLGEVKSAEQLVIEQIRLLNTINADNLSLASAHIKAGTIFEAQDNLEQSEFHFKQAVNLAPLSKGVNEQSVRAALSLANSLHRLNKGKQAERLIHDLSDFTPQIQQIPDSGSMLAALHAMEATALLSKQDFDTAMARLQLAKKYAIKVTDDPLLYPHILGLESDANYDHGQLNKSADLDRQMVNYFSETFGEDHPETIDNLGRLAVSLAALGELESAIEINQRIIANLKDIEMKGHQLPAAYLNMGTAYQALGDHSNALKSYQIAQTLWSHLTPRILIYEASTQVKTATSLLALKHYDEAQQFFTSALDTIEHQYGQDHPLYARFQIMYAPLLLELNELEEAKSIIPNARRILSDAYGKQAKHTAIATLRMAQLNQALGNHRLATEQAEQVIEILDVPEYRKRNQAHIDLAQKITKTIH